MTLQQQFNQFVKIGIFNETAANQLEQHILTSDDIRINENEIHIDVYHNYGSLRYSCMKGNLEMAKWLYNIYFIKSKTLNPRFLFVEACSENQFEIAKWLFDLALQSDFGLLSVNGAIEGAFQNCCRSGYFEIIKWLYDLYLTYPEVEKIDIHACNERAFEYACTNNKMEVAKWLLDLCTNDPSLGDININMNNNFIFRDCCARGHLTMAKFLFQLSLDRDELIDIHVENEDAFKRSCGTNSLDVIKWLCQLCLDYPQLGPINVNLCSGDQFCTNMMYCNLETLKYIYPMYRERGDISLLCSWSFSLGCKYAKLETVEWIYELPNYDSKIDPMEITNTEFEESCIYGNIQIAQWIYSISNGAINICANNDALFRNCCEKGRVSIALWLASLEPSYKISVDEDNQIINWCINSPIHDFIANPTSEKYIDALNYLKIKDIAVTDSQSCIICHETHEPIIKLKCEHCICLEYGYQWFNNRQLKCAYCEEPFKWDECSNCIMENSDSIDILDI